MASKAFTKAPYRKDDWVTAKEVCEKLGITRKTLSNRISAGRIRDTYISVGECRDKFFYLPGIMGFHN